MTIKDEIIHYAGFKMSMRATAEAIGVKHHIVREVVKEEGLRHLFDPKSYILDCRGGNRKGCPRPYYRGSDGRIWKPGEPTYSYLAARSAGRAQ